MDTVRGFSWGIVAGTALIKFWVFVLLAPLLSACSADVSDAAHSICSGDSEATFGFWIAPIGTENANVEETFFSENGTGFFYLDGQCHAWIWLPRATEEYSPYWSPLFVTELQHEDVVELLEDVDWSDWSSLAGRTFTADLAGGVRTTVFDRGTEFVLEGYGNENGRAKLRAIRNNLLEHAEEIADMGDEATGDVRVLVRRDNGSLDEYSQFPPRLEWPELTVPPQELVLETAGYDSHCVGVSHLFTGEEARLFRQYRREYRELPGYPRGNWIPFRHNGGLFKLWMRDSLPFEAPDTGLVERPEFTPYRCPP